MKQTLKRVLAVAAMASLTACGSARNAAGPSATASVSAVSDASFAPGAKVTVSQLHALLDPSLGHLRSVHVVMTVSLKMGSVAMTEHGTGDMGRVNGLVVMAMHVNIQTIPQAGDIEMRLTSGGFYMKMAAPQLGGKWIRIDLNDKSNPLGSMFASISSMAPDQMFTKYSGGVTGGTYVGRDGHGDHFQMTVDTAKQIANLPGAFKSNPAALRALKAMPPTQTVNYWLSGGKVVRMQTSMGALGALTMDLSKYGEPISVVAPPLSDTTPFTALYSSGQLPA